VFWQDVSMPYLEFFEDFVMVTPSSSWMFQENEQKSLMNLP